MSKPNLNKSVFQIFPEAKESIEEELCPLCRKLITKFRDSISEREYSISGMCQSCQDSVFGGGE